MLKGVHMVVTNSLIWQVT